MKAMKSSVFTFFLISCLLVLPALASKEDKARTQTEPTTTNQMFLQEEIYESDLECPTWFVPVTKNDTTWCECRDHIIQGGAVLRCPNTRIVLKDQYHGKNDLNVSILTLFCMTHDFDQKQTVVALCPHDFSHQNAFNFFVTLPSNISELNDFMCGNMRRQGELCNRCIDNARPSIFIESLECFKIEHTNLSWLYFIGLTFIQPTVFFLVVLLCKVQTTTGPLNALIFFSQTLTAILLLNNTLCSVAVNTRSHEDWKSASDGARAVLIEAVSMFYTFWYNQCSWTIKSAVNTKLFSIIQVQALQYATALYPLLLILLCCIVIWLHNHGCGLLRCMRKLLCWCTSCSKVKWDPISSIVHTFATFLLLVYTKILVVSFNLLAPTRIYNQSGELDYKIMSYDSSIHFLSQRHMPYVILSLSMLTVFCGLPLLILFLYPMACFQRLLNKTPVLFSEVLRTFGNAYTGCYKDKTDSEGVERRYFASFYFLIRIIYFSCLYFVEYSYAWLALILVPLLVTILFAALQPYRKRWLNAIDSVAFGLVALVTLLYAYNVHVARIPPWIPSTLLAIPFMYFVVLVFCMIVIKVRSCLKTNNSEHRRDDNNTSREFKESLFGRGDEREDKVGSEAAPLLNPLHA